MITLKKLEDVPVERNAANTKNLRLAHATWLMQNIQNADLNTLTKPASTYGLVEHVGGLLVDSERSGLYKVAADIT